MPEPLPSSAPPPLAGFTVAVTAARRAEELAGMLARRGADVLRAPALRIVPLADDRHLRDATRELLERPPDTVVATTGIGFRGWTDAADGWGDGEALHAVLAAAELVARGPKAKGAIRAAGLQEAWSPPSESSAELLQRLLDAGDLTGRRIAVQLHGEPLHGFTDALRAAGAHVVPVPVYRWTEPADPGPLDRLVDAIAAGAVDAVTFTSALAATGLLRRADASGRGPALAEALHGRTRAVCVGPVTAGPLRERGIPAEWPERHRTGALVRRVCEVLPGSAVRVALAGHALEVRGSAVVVDGAVRAVPPGPLSVLRTLAGRPGEVLSRAELGAVLGGAGTDGHAVETAVARLRAALGTPGIVDTVTKRGYRLPAVPGTPPG